MIKKLFILTVLALLILGRAEAPVKEDEPTQITPQDVMYERQQDLQHQMMQQSKPFKVGPGRRF